MNPPMKEPVQSSFTSPDGPCRTWIFRPDGQGPWPVVVFLHDGFGVRPAMIKMAQRLSEHSYIALMPDLFHRNGAYDPVDVRAAFASGDAPGEARRLLGNPPSISMALSDLTAVFSFVQNDPDAGPARFGVVGYCMSGAMALAAAGYFPHLVAAAAAFHAGSLVTGQKDSPDLLVQSAQAEVYIGGAEIDRWCPPEVTHDFCGKLQSASIRHTCEIYPGTRHGWTIPDLPIYDEEAAERHWERLIALLDRNLKKRT